MQERQQDDEEELSSNTVSAAASNKTGSKHHHNQRFEPQQHHGTIISICRRTLTETRALVASEDSIMPRDTSKSAMANISRKYQSLVSPTGLEGPLLEDAIALYTELHGAKESKLSSSRRTPATLIPPSDDDEPQHKKKQQRTVFPEQYGNPNDPASDASSNFDEVAYVTSTMAACDISRTNSSKRSKFRSALYRNEITLHERRRSKTLSKARQSARVKREKNKNAAAPASRKLDEQQEEQNVSTYELDLGIFSIDNASFLDAETMAALMNNSCCSLDTCDSLLPEERIN
jgi:hypothetical protein